MIFQFHLRSLQNYKLLYEYFCFKLMLICTMTINLFENSCVASLVLQKINKTAPLVTIKNVKLGAIEFSCKTQNRHFVLLKFENKLHTAISHRNFNSVHHDKLKYASTFIWLVTLPSLYITGKLAWVRKL